MGQWKLTKQIEIDSSHYLRDYDGKCANMHGHRWKIFVEICGNKLNEQEMIKDFSDIKKEIMRYDHKCLNDIEPFNEINPTAENMAKYFCEIVGADKVTIYETPGACVEYVPD